MDLDSFLVSLYVLVDDWWQEHHPPAPRKKSGRPVLLSESEVLTLAILAQWSRFIPNPPKGLCICAVGLPTPGIEHDPEG
jgi:hypothetical protein